VTCCAKQLIEPVEPAADDAFAFVGYYVDLAAIEPGDGS
jgi:hypothetical protein